MSATVWADAPGPCDVIEAEFVFGPQRCLRSARLKTESDGEWFYICDTHAADRAEAAS